MHPPGWILPGAGGLFSNWFAMAMGRYLSSPAAILRAPLFRMPAQR